MPYPPTSVRIRAICGRPFSTRSFCAFRGFCGSTTACLVGAAETAAPPEIASVPSVEVSSQQEISVRSVGSVGIQFSHRLHRFSQMIGCVSGCVGTTGCHTLLHLCASVLSVGDPSLQEASVRSVGSVGVPLLAWLVQQRLLHPLRLHQCHLWKSLLNKKFLCVLWVLWEAIP